MAQISTPRPLAQSPPPIHQPCFAVGRAEVTCPLSSTMNSPCHAVSQALPVLALLPRNSSNSFDSWAFDVAQGTPLGPRRGGVSTAIGAPRGGRAAKGATVANVELQCTDYAKGQRLNSVLVATTRGRPAPTPCAAELLPRSLPYNSMPCMCLSRLRTARTTGACLTSRSRVAAEASP